VKNISPTIGEYFIVRAKEGYNLSDILRDFKKFTSKKIVEAIQTEPESRREWLLHRFKSGGDPLAAKSRTNVENYKFWQDGNHAMECFSAKFTLEKLNYIHQNPVRAFIVDEPEHYIYSSARDYTGVKGLIDVILLD
jgi:putative transposase